jgi:hypothetical protein
MVMLAKIRRMHFHGGDVTLPISVSHPSISSSTSVRRRLMHAISWHSHALRRIGAFTALINQNPGISVVWLPSAET